MTNSWKKLFYTTAAIVVLGATPALATSSSGSGSAGASGSASASGSGSSGAASGYSTGNATGNYTPGGNETAGMNPRINAGAATGTTTGTSANSGTGTGVSAGATINGGASANSSQNSGGMSGYTTGGGTVTSGDQSARGNAAVGFNASDRTTLTNYVRELPNGVRSSAASSSQFRVGETLPGDMQTTTLPADLSKQITAAPNGYSYVQSGADVYLISNDNRRIVDRVGIR